MSYPRPAADEYAPHYATYIARVRDGDIVQILAEQSDAIRGLFARVPNDRGHFAYAPGKWTLNEVLLHVIDTERVFGYRALRIARGDTIPLHSFEQDDWVPQSGANKRSLHSIVDEFVMVRAATVALFRGVAGRRVEPPRDGVGLHRDGARAGIQVRRPRAASRRADSREVPGGLVHAWMTRPRAASAASLVASPSVGCEWHVSATSSVVPRNSIANTTSESSSDTFGPDHVTAEDFVRAARRR